MIQQHQPLKYRFTSWVGLAAIASLIALPGLAQTTPPGTTPSPTSPTSPVPGRPTSPSNTTPGSTTPDNTTPPGSITSPGSTTPATPDSGDTSPTRGAVSALDREFFTLAYQGNNAEIQTSQLALQQSQDQAVRQYAERMINEHTQANQLLTRYADQQNLSTPSEPIDPLNQAIAEQLGQLSGTAFDQAYMGTQVNAHLRTIALYRTQVAQGQEQNLKGYASQLLPSIQDHYQMASEMSPNRTAGEVRPNPNMMRPGQPAQPGQSIQPGQPAQPGQVVQPAQPVRPGQSSPSSPSGQ